MWGKPGKLTMCSEVPGHQVLEEWHIHRPGVSAQKWLRGGHWVVLVGVQKAISQLYMGRIQLPYRWLCHSFRHPPDIRYVAACAGFSVSV